METKYSSSCNLGNILNLPNEILLRIFRFVPTYDLLKNLALVNNRFYELTKNNSVIGYGSGDFTLHTNVNDGQVGFNFI